MSEEELVRRIRGDLEAIIIKATAHDRDERYSSPADLAADLVTAEGQLQNAISASTSLGVAEKSIEDQQNFISSLTDTIDSGIGSMVDANMEEEAAKLQAYQVQQQLATQSLAIANQSPGNILSLFR